MTAIHPLYSEHAGSRLVLRALRRQQRHPAGIHTVLSTTTQTATTMPEIATISTIAPQNDPDSLRDLRDRLRAIAEDDKSYSQSRIAKEAGVSTATFSQFLGGTYGGNNAKIAETLISWLESYERRLRDGGLPQGPEWIETPSAKKILSALGYAQLGADMVGICGPSGVSKSRSIMRYAKTHPSVFHVEMSPATSGVLGCLEEIAREIGIKIESRQAAFLFRSICARLRNTCGLLVIDEAQHLGFQALDQVRAIHDKCGVGIALVGNEQVFSQMSGTRAAYLDRVYSRIGKWVHVKKATQSDADAIIEAWGVTDARCRDRIREIAARPGALRTLTKVLRLAATYAQAANRAMCCDDIQAAWRELGGLE